MHYLPFAPVTCHPAPQCLALCKQHKITDATAWLLERKGDIHAAYALIHATAMGRLKALNTAFVEWEVRLCVVCALRLQCCRPLLFFRCCP